MMKMIESARMRTPCRRESGLSLIELMVALAISSLILIGLVQVFTTSRLVYNTDEAVARVQENGRFSIEFMARDIRMAGNMGCLGDIDPSKVNNYVANASASPEFDMTRGGVEGYEAAGTAPGDTVTLPTLYPATLAAVAPPVSALVPSAVAQSDILVLRGMDPEATKLAPPYNDSAQVFVTQPNSFDAGQILMVTDCKRMSVFQATAVSAGGGKTNIAHASGGSPGNTCPNWGAGGCPGKDYEAGAQIARFNVSAYYVGVGTYGGPSLIRRDWTSSGAPVDLELVEGVENMQVVYGLDSNAADNTRMADRYVPASLVTDWSQVVSVRISLLVSGQISGKASGQSELAADAAVYSVGGVIINPPANDRHQRRVFTTNVRLRNR